MPPQFPQPIPRPSVIILCLHCPMLPPSLSSCASIAAHYITAASQPLSQNGQSMYSSNPLLLSLHYPSCRPCERLSLSVLCHHFRSRQNPMCPPPPHCRDSCPVRPTVGTLVRSARRHHVSVTPASLPPFTISHHPASLSSWCLCSLPSPSSCHLTRDRAHFTLLGWDTGVCLHNHPPFHSDCRRCLRFSVSRCCRTGLILSQPLLYGSQISEIFVVYCC